ncbi:MAG: ISAzo13 family transposase, partial [Acaryochloridaceae cyanobacterium CSU_3_4]|nr:ISAzo13 family transposase [Acaryochloridaceae cyanobacterium CSU_3_4]
MEALETLVEPSSQGDPMSALCWTCKSTRRLAKELSQEGHRVSHTKVYQLLQQLNYSLQSIRKTREGISHPDRNEQFEYINQQVRLFQNQINLWFQLMPRKRNGLATLPIKVANTNPKGSLKKSVCMILWIKTWVKHSPMVGIYDVTQNCGWVSVGVDHDTVEFAIATLRQWWEHMGKQMYPHAQQLLITSDGGGSNSSRSRLWKT